MKILLLGEYSGLHLTLAKGLKELGHEVTLASDGDGFKNYYRDIDLKRESSGVIDTLSSLFKVCKSFRSFKGYDIVQIINPCFTTQNIRINLILYRFLKRNNGKVFLGAFGDDYFWLKACLDKQFRYSEFYIGDKENNLPQNDAIRHNWLHTKRRDANIEMAESCDGIIACLYEYYAAYQPRYTNKLTYLPLSVDVKEIRAEQLPSTEKVNFFIGINKARSEFKGSDLFLQALERLKKDYPEEVEIIKAESLSYDEYLNRIKEAHVVLDQVYSYSPAMNGLLTLALGKVLVSGGEPEMYELLGESSNKPIVNVYPTLDNIYEQLEQIVLNKDKIKDRAEAGRRFVEVHHDYRKVAAQYLEFWKNRK